MMWTIPTYSSKMAENQDVSRFGSIFVGGQARALLNAMAHFENKRQRGRAGRGPIVANNNGVGRLVGQGRGLPRGRVPILNARMPELGGSLILEREGQRPLSPCTHHTSINPTMTFSQRISSPIPTQFTPSP